MLWIIPCDVSLLTRPFWLWISVGYTWLLAVLAIVARILVLKKVGTQRSGSSLATAAMVDDADGPFKNLVERGYMHGRIEFDLDMENRRDLWMREVKLGVRADGRFGIGRADEVAGLLRRNRNRSFQRSRNGGETNLALDDCLQVGQDIEDESVNISTETLAVVAKN